MAAPVKASICALILFCCGLQLSNAVLNIVPSNDAVLAGTTVTLRCQLKELPEGRLPRVMWTEFSTSSGGVIVSDGKNLVQSHPNAARYSIVGDLLDYNLEIRNVTVGDGGTYLCQDINGGRPEVFRGFAELIVLQSNPVCSDFVTITGVVIEGNSYSSECEVRYKGNIAPVMRWSGPGNFVTNGSTSTTSVWAWKRFTADRLMEGDYYSCYTQFPNVSMPEDHANNTPTYDYFYRGASLNVRWGPKDIAASPIKQTYDIGDVLTCTSDSNPPSTFRWTNMRTLVTQPPSPNFTVTSDLAGFFQQMRCQAETVIEGSLLTGNIFVNVTVPAITTTTVTSPTSATTPPLDGPCNDLSGQWRSTSPSAQICIEIDGKGNILALIRNGSDPYFVPGNGKSVVNDYRHVGFSGVWPTGLGVGGFTGECHNCAGTEVILLSGLSRNKAEAPNCGASAGTHFTQLYVLNRSGPPCRGLELDVWNPKPWILENMGVIARPYIAN